MTLLTIMEDAVTNGYGSILIYGENHDNGLTALLKAAEKNYNRKRILFLTNALKCVDNFNIGIKNCSSNDEYLLGTNILHFNNVHKFWGTSQDDLIIVYPTDELLLDAIHKNNHEIIDRILTSYCKKIIFLTEYNVKLSHLDYIKSRVQKVIEVDDEEQ